MKVRLKIGSMHGVVPVMLAMVAVGAIAMVLLLRMPCFATFARSGAQSIVVRRSRAVSIGKMPRSHLEPL
ncbi:hypothetical protein D9M70_517400 [compost metagenome]